MSAPAPPLRVSPPPPSGPIGAPEAEPEISELAAGAGWAVGPVIGGLLVLAAVGTLCIGSSYARAADGASASTRYGLFWIGMLVVLLPAFGVVIARTTSDAARYGAVVVVGLFTLVPKLLRNPSAPLYHDEYVHSRAVEDILRSGHPFNAVPVLPVVKSFPGLHLATATIRVLTGLDVWRSGQLIVGTAHVITLLGIFVLVRALGGGVRTAAVAALFYALNPSYVYFDTQFAYESLAICFYVWVLVGCAVAARELSQRLGFVALGLVVVGALALTHHLTSLILCATLVFAAVAAAVVRVRARLQGDRGPAVLGWGALLTLVLTGGVLGASARQISNYLSPYFGSAIRQFSSIARGSSSGRELFSARVQPLYEPLAGQAMPVLLLVLSVLALWAIRHRRIGSMAWGLVVFGLLYFPSVPLILTEQGAEGARRTWAFTYVGLAVLISFGFTAFAEWFETQPLRRVSALALCFGAFSVLAVGGVAVGLNDPYRFPGPYLYGSDTRSVDAEAIAMARAFGDAHGTQHVVADRYTGLPLVGYGRAFPAINSEGFPVHELVSTTGDPTPALRRSLESSGYRYLIVDRRGFTLVPYLGIHFSTNEPSAIQGKALPVAALERLDRAAWAALVASTDHFAVYRLDLDQIGKATR